MAGIGCFVCSSFNRQSVGRVVASTVSSAGPAPAVTTPSTPTPPPPPTPTSASPARRAGGPQWPGQDRAQHVVFLEMGCSPPPTASSWSGFWVSQGILILLQSSLSISSISTLQRRARGSRCAAAARTAARSPPTRSWSGRATAAHSTSRTGRSVSSRAGNKPSRRLKFQNHKEGPHS